MKLTEKAKESLRGEVVTEHDLLDILTHRIVVDWATQQKAARELDISMAFLHDILHGKRGVGDKIPKYFGYKRVVVYVKEVGDERDF